MLTQTQRKTIALHIAVLLLFAFGIVGVPWLRTMRSWYTFDSFCRHIRKGHWSAAQALVADESGVFRVKVGAVDYGGIDVTADMSRARPSRVEMFRHNFDHPFSGNVVYFYFGSAGGQYNYADIRGGKICNVKIP